MSTGTANDHKVKNYPYKTMPKPFCFKARRILSLIFVTPSVSLVPEHPVVPMVPGTFIFLHPTVTGYLGEAPELTTSSSSQC